MFHSTGKRATFKNNEPDKDGNYVIINFNHLIQVNQLQGNFVLEHWNKIDKLWGYYDSKTDKYYIVSVSQLIQPFYKAGERISMDYNKKILPTDAILFRDSSVSTVQGKLTIVEAK